MKSFDFGIYFIYYFDLKPLLATVLTVSGYLYMADKILPITNIIASDLICGKSLKLFGNYETKTVYHI